MQGFLQLRIGSRHDQLPVVLGRFAGGQHVASMLPGPIGLGCAHIVVVWLLQIECT